MQDAIVGAFFEICLYLALGCGIMGIIILLWVYVLKEIPKEILDFHKSLTRPYDPEKDYKNPLNK